VVISQLSVVISQLVTNSQAQAQAQALAILQLKERAQAQAEAQAQAQVQAQAQALAISQEGEFFATFLAQITALVGTSPYVQVQEGALVLVQQLGYNEYLIG
jgi:hypothetical protein